MAMSGVIRPALGWLRSGGRAGGAAAANAGVSPPITFWDWPKPVVVLLGCRRWRRWPPVSSIAEASAVIERLTGMKLPRATLDREARRQGKRVENTRQQMDEQLSRGEGSEQLVPELRSQEPGEPFTLVIELDAWNIRERNDEQWGRTEELRQAGEEPKWWHWVYGGTCFRLS